MSDRFKFRVWDIRNGVYFKDPNPTPPLNSNGTLGFTYDKPNFQKYYIIEQCTGLSDKNGNLIYEGDILTEFCNPQANYIIKWDEKNAKFGLWYVDHFIVGQISRDGGNLCWLPSEFVITGNIHEQVEQKDVK